MTHVSQCPISLRSEHPIYEAGISSVLIKNQTKTISLLTCRIAVNNMYMNVDIMLTVFIASRAAADILGREKGAF
jgi:hypothetical protein